MKDNVVINITFTTVRAEEEEESEKIYTKFFRTPPRFGDQLRDYFAQQDNKGMQGNDDHLDIFGVRREGSHDVLDFMKRVHDDPILKKYIINLLTCPCRVCTDFWHNL